MIKTMRKDLFPLMFPLILIWILLFVTYHVFFHLKEHIDKEVYTIIDNNQSITTTQGDCINGLYFVYGNGIAQVIGHDGKPVSCTSELIKGSKFKLNELWD
jgi:hypothetical protein